MTLKRITALSVILCIITLSMPVYAAEPPTVTVGEAQAENGETFTLDVSLENNPGICSYIFSIDYDTEALSLISVNPAEDFGGQFNFSKKAVWFSSEDISLDGTILTLQFDVKDGASLGYYPIDISGEICNYDEETIEFQSVSGGVSVVAAESPTISLSAIKGSPDSEVLVNVDISNNPGICSFILEFSYDETAMTLESVSQNDVIGGQFSFYKKAVWISSSDCSYNGTFLTLKFRINSTAPLGDYTVKVKYPPGGICDYAENDIAFELSNGVVSVVSSVLIGDINNDGIINNNDLTFLKRYLSGGKGVSIDPKASDVNKDDQINNLDFVMLGRFLKGGIGSLG